MLQERIFKKLLSQSVPLPLCADMIRLLAIQKHCKETRRSVSSLHYKCGFTFFYVLDRKAAYSLGCLTCSSLFPLEWYIWDKAWFVDADTLWLRPPELDPGWSKSVFGHVVASLTAHAGSMCRGTTIEREKYWRVNFLREPNEQLLCASPFRFPGLSPFLDKLVSGLQEEFRKSSGSKYLAFMNLFDIALESAHISGLALDVSLLSIYA